MSQDDSQLNEEDPNADNLRHLREQADENKATKAENEKLRKEALFLKAGIDVDSDDERTKTLATMLFNQHTGDDIEALKTTAKMMGLLDEKAPVDESERQQQQFRQDLSRGQQINPNDVQTADPHAEALKAFHEARQNGTQLEDAQYAAIDKVFMAAAKGDKRAIFDAGAWERTRQEAGHGQ